MKTLEELRKEIDAADADIVAALARRFAISDRVRELKCATGLPPIDAARERAICERAMAGVPAAHRDTVFSVYERILGGSRGMVETIARGVAIADGKILLCRAKGGKSAYLPGGHIEFGETGREALVREVKEELGVDATAGKFLGVVENSFLQHGKPHAEINLVYELSLGGLDGNNSTVQPSISNLQPVSQEDWIEFEWCPLKALKNANLLPAAFNVLGENPSATFAV